MNAPSNLPATLSQAVAGFESQLSQRASVLAKALPSHISIDKFQRTLMAAVKADPELLKADRASLFNACEKAALDCLLPDKREAALVVFKRNFKDAQGNWQQALEVTYMPMVYGLRKKILQSGEVADITAKVVYRREAEEGAFIYEEGTESMLRHRPILDLTEDEARDENMVAVYSMATYKDGTKSYEVMRRFEVEKVRESSQTGATRDKRGNLRKPSGPWVEWQPEQFKKTCIRRHSKTLPMSGDIIDVEGREVELIARSTSDMLAIEADAPRALPSSFGEDRALSDQSGTEGGVEFDPDTGELPERDNRGMSEVDEQTARDLDAGVAEGDPQDPHNGPATEQRGEAHTDADAPMWRKDAETALAGVRAAKNPTYLTAIEEAWLKARAAVEDSDLINEVEAAFTAKRKALRAAKESG